MSKCGSSAHRGGASAAEGWHDPLAQPRDQPHGSLHAAAEPVEVGGLIEEGDVAGTTTRRAGSFSTVHMSASDSVIRRSKRMGRSAMSGRLATEPGQRGISA